MNTPNAPVTQEDLEEFSQNLIKKVQEILAGERAHTKGVVNKALHAHDYNKNRHHKMSMGLWAPPPLSEEDND